MNVTTKKVIKLSKKEVTEAIEKYVEKVSDPYDQKSLNVVFPSSPDLRNDLDFCIVEIEEEITTYSE